MPKERRDALWAEVKKKASSEGQSSIPGVQLTASASEKVLFASKSASKLDVPTAGAPGPSSAPASEDVTLDVVRDRVERASEKVDKQFRV